MLRRSFCRLLSFLCFRDDVRNGVFAAHGAVAALAVAADARIELLALLAEAVDQECHGKAEHHEAAGRLGDDADLIAFGNDADAEEGAGTEKFSHHGDADDDDGIAAAHAEAVKKGIHHAVLAREHFRAAEHDAVDDDQGKEDAERVVQVGQERFHDHLHQGHEGCDDHDEAGDADLVRDHFPQQGNDDVGADQNEGQRHAHAESALDGHGDRKHGAAAEQKDQDGVLFKDAVDKDLPFSLFHLFPPPYLILSNAARAAFTPFLTAALV